MGCRLPHLHLPHPYKQALGSPASSAVCGGGPSGTLAQGLAGLSWHPPPPQWLLFTGSWSGEGARKGVQWLCFEDLTAVGEMLWQEGLSVLGLGL